MPKLWSKTIESHKQEVRQEILNATASLVIKKGLLAVTMSSVAEQANISRATLYKYFSSIEEVLTAWHERHVRKHFAQLVQISKQQASAQERLYLTLKTYASLAYETRMNQDVDLVALLHRDKHVMRARTHLKAFLEKELAAAKVSGSVREDFSSGELADYCIHALGAASVLTSKAALERLVKLIMSGLAKASLH